MNDITVLESEEYEQTRQALAADPILLAMFTELPPPIQLQLRDGTLEDRYGMMTTALREYNARGGTQSKHIGGVIEALEMVARR